MDDAGPVMVELPRKKETQILKVYYKDSTFKSYDLPEDVTSAEVCARFASKFLRISERAASHFSLHLIIHGKDLKQLKPTDKPIKIQRELCELSYVFNTAEDENYFLFCLNDETKSKMNDLCERNSILLNPQIADPPPRKERRSQTMQPQSTPQKNGTFSRAHSVLALVKPAKDKLSFLKRKPTDRPKSPEPKDDASEPKPHSQPEKPLKDADKPPRERRESTPTRIAHQLQHVLGFATHVNPHTSPSLTLSSPPEPAPMPTPERSPTPTLDPPASPPTPATGSTVTEVTTPGDTPGDVSPNSSSPTLSSSLPPTMGSSPHSIPSPTSGFTDSPPITPDSPGPSMSSPSSLSSHYPPSTPGSSPKSSPTPSPGSVSPKMRNSTLSPRHTPPSHALPPTPPRNKKLEVHSPQLSRPTSIKMRPASIRLSMGPPKSAKEDLDELISNVFEKPPEAKEEDAEKLMDHMFDWFQGNSTEPASTPTPSTPEPDAEEDFDDILDALDKLNAV